MQILEKLSKIALYHQLYRGLDSRIRECQEFETKRQKESFLNKKES